MHIQLSTYRVVYATHDLRHVVQFSFDIKSVKYNVMHRALNAM